MKNVRKYCKKECEENIYILMLGYDEQYQMLSAEYAIVEK
jgi:hypothetical protein